MDFVPSSERGRWNAAESISCSACKLLYIHSVGQKSEMLLGPMPLLLHFVGNVFAFVEVLSGAFRCYMCLYICTFLIIFDLFCVLYHICFAVIFVACSLPNRLSSQGITHPPLPLQSEVACLGLAQRWLVATWWTPTITDRPLWSPPASMQCPGLWKSLKTHQCLKPVLLLRISKGFEKMSLNFYRLNHWQACAAKWKDLICSRL